MSAILLNMAVKGTVVLAVAWLVALLLRRRTAAARHLVWTAASAALIALPFLSVGLPALQIPAHLVDLSAASNIVFRAFATAPPADGVAVAPAAPAARQSAQPTAAALPAAGPVIVWVWGAGAALVISQMLVAYARMWRRRRTAQPFRNNDLDHDVPVLEAPAGSMPMMFGVLSPVIFLPADACEWPAERRRIVLLHELAHARRGDAATHLLARTALSLHWWNPLAWIAWREFVKERERAADDMVLDAGARASEYAAHLLEVARLMQSARATGAVAVAMARSSQLEGRLMAILDAGRRRGSFTGLASLAAAVLAVALVAPFAAMRAQSNPVPPEIDATIRAANSQKNHEILDRAARAYEDLYKFEMANMLLEAALPIRGEVAGQQSAAYAAGLVKLGDLAVRRRQRVEAEAFYGKAVSLGDRPEVATALMYLGLKSFREKDAEGAADFIERAFNVDPKGPQAGAALRWLAMVRQNQPDRIGEVESLFQRALAIQDPNSFEAVTTQELYAMFLGRLGRNSEADSLRSRAREIRHAHAAEYAQTEAAISSVHKVGGDVSAPKLVSKIEPEYSEEARAAKFQGSVLLYVAVGPDGRAHNIRVARSLGLGLDEKAVESVKQWTFQPGAKNGVPVPVAATIEVNFRLM